jgi:predicted MFS family arabinose efflux permease
MREGYELERKVSEKLKARLLETIKQSIRVMKSQRLILALLILFLFSEFAFEAISQFWQVHFDENLSIPTQYFGWIAAIAFLVTILLVDKVAAVSGKFKHETSSLIILESLFLVSLLALALAGSPVLAAILFILLHSFVNFKEPIFLDLYNKRIPSAQRATLLSFLSLIGSTGEVLAGLCIGIVAIKFGLRITFGFGTVLLFVGIVAFLLLATSRRSRSGP